MEQDQTSEMQELRTKPKQSVWNTVTPISKYLAMALFIILPFVGGYMGYVYGPEKVVEKTVSREIVVEERSEIGQSLVSDVAFGNNEVEIEKNSKIELETTNNTDPASDKKEIIDWAEFNISPVVNPHAINQIGWHYTGNIFSALPAEKTYALFAVIDQQNTTVYSSIVGDGVSIDESINKVYWGNNNSLVPPEDLYGKLIEGGIYRYRATLGYASESETEHTFKTLAARHVSYSDWFVVNWDTSVNQLVIEHGDVTIYEGDRVGVIVADVMFGLGDSERIVTNYNPNVPVLDSILAAFKAKGMNVGSASSNTLNITVSDDVYSGDDIIIVD